MKTELDERRWQLAKELFAQALELSPAEQQGFVAGACAGDQELLDELRSMLDAHQGAGEFFSDPSAAVKHAVNAAHPKGLVAPGEQLGDFRIVREIGRGGMGVVYEAEQLSLHRSVALKLLPAALTLQPGAIARFRREAELAAKLDHPAVVRVLAAGEERGIAYLAMELVDGLALDQLIRGLRSEGLEELSGKRMSTLLSTQAPRPSGTTRAGHSDTWSGSHVEAACRIVLQIADGLEQAHHSGVVHRDVKPANILVRPDGSAVLTDFGLAFARDLPGLSQSGDVLGTPAYLSPEQARGRHAAIDHRTDVYSLGVTLYELLSLRRPHEVESLNEALQRIQTEEPLPLPRLNPRIPADLATIVHKAIEKQPARRYASAGALAADLRAFLEHRPIAARPPSVAYNVGRFSRRHRALIGGALAVFVALLVGLFATTSMAAKERAARGEEAEQRKKAERELAIRAQIFEFLHQVLTDFKPGESDMSVREMVDRAAARAEKGLGEDPLVEAEVRSMLAYNYKRMGDPERAVPHLRRQIEILETTRGIEANETLDALTVLGGVLQDCDRALEAEPIVRRVAELRQAQLGEDDPVALQAKSYLSVVLRRIGRLEEAEATMLELAQKYASLDGRDFERALVMHNLAYVRMKQGRPEGTLDSLREAVPVLVKTFGEADAETYKFLGTLADATQDAGDYAGAEAILADALDRCRIGLGPAHPSTIGLVNRLTSVQEAQGRFAQAADQYGELAEAVRAQYGSASTELGEVLHHRAIDLAQIDELVEAELCAREAANIYAAAKASPPHELRHCAEVLNRILGTKGVSPAERAKALRPLLESQRRNVPPDHVDLIMPHALLGAALLESGDLAESERLVRESLRIAAIHWTPESHQYSNFLNTRMLLAEILLRGRQHEEAERLFLDAYENLGSAPHELSLKASAAERLADSCAERGEPEVAAQWRARVQDLRNPSGR